MSKQPLSLSLLVVCLLALPSCFHGKKEEGEKSAVEASALTSGNRSQAPLSIDGKTKNTATPSGNQSQVLLSIDGEPKITVADLERYKEQFFMIQPQYKQILQYMPASEQIKLDQNIFANMANEILFQVWVEKSGVDKKAEYQQDFKMITDMAKRNLAIKYYQEAHPAQVSSDDVKKFYDDNKDKMRELMVSPGGVNAKVVKFEKEADAKEFLAKAKAAGSVEKAAKEAGHKVEDLNQVSAMSFHVDTPVREKLLAVKNFPAQECVKVDDKSHCVVHAIEKTKPEYVAFEDVKAELTEYLKQQKMHEALTKAAEQLKKEYKTVENADYFTSRLSQAEQADQDKQDGQKPGSKGDQVGLAEDVDADFFNKSA